MTFNGTSLGQYQPLTECHEERDPPLSSFHPARYREHVKYSRNPDQFYVDIYNYHQSGGFWALLLAEVLWTVKFVFIIFIGVEITVCTRWEVLTNSSVPFHEWGDVFTPPGRCWASLPLLPSLLVAVCVVTLITQVIIAIGRLRRFWETRLFCTYILNMPTSSTGLGDMTWTDVQKRLIESQPQTGADELAICHRIVRHENYLIAMVDRDILPVRFKLASVDASFVHVFLPDAYLFNLKLLLFWTPWSPFSQHWLLKSEYKEIARRHELASHLTGISRVLGVLNLLFAPVILLAQFLVFVCSNAERIRYHPASIVGRRWSNYAHLYLRHYNELRHQFLVRIGLAYQPACDYLNCFVSQHLISLAETVAFVLGSASVAFFLLGLMHEQVMHLNGYWAVLVLGGLLARTCLSYIPDENIIRSPRALLITVLGKIHRFPDYWIELAATSRVCAEFSQLFQYRLVAALEDLVSTFVTPFILLFVVPNHTLEIVDFLRNYSVELKELGDVCSCAQLDVRRHGDPQWKFFGSTDGTEETVTDKPVDNETSTQPLLSTGGKTELSLMHFHLNNPAYVLPSASRIYLESIRRQLLRDMTQFVFRPSVTGTERPSDDVGPSSTLGLFSSLYGSQNLQTADQPGFASTTLFDSHTCTSIGPLRNVSHLPGPRYINGDNLGFVGAIVESMKRSSHSSNTGMIQSASSDTTIPKPTVLAAPKESVIPDEIQTNVAHPLPTTSSEMVGAHGPFVVPVTDDPTLPTFSQSCGADPVNMSLMAASALFFANNSGFPAYKPYMSQVENGSHWGLCASSALGFSSSKHGLTELFTADTSATILYMHELAHRRRLQQSTYPSPSSQRPMDRSYITGATGSLYGSGDAASVVPYQLSYALGPSARSSTRSQVMHASRTPSERGHTLRLGYGTAASNESVGIIRTSLDGRYVSRPPVARVTEEDELAITPRTTSDSAFRAVVVSTDTTPLWSQRSTPNAPAGIVTVSGSPSSRPRLSMSPASGMLSDTADITPVLNEETDTEHVWPDLPPTNC